jgi:hypothetical protein
LAFLLSLFSLRPQTLSTGIVGAALVAWCGLAVVSAGVMAAACLVSLWNRTPH